ADQFRSDLLGAGLGKGQHGFVVRGLSSLFPFSRHRVRVRRATDGVDLPGSPVWLSRPVMDGQSIDFIDQVLSSAIRVARAPNELVEPLDHILRLLNELVNANDGLMRAHGTSDGPSILETAASAGLTNRMRELVDQLQSNHAPMSFDPSD